MTRVKRSRALSWLCTLAAAAALALVLFPVYAILVGSFESTNTLFSGTFYWLPHAATLDNYRTVLGGANAATQETVSGSQTGAVLTSLLVGLGTALLALVVAVPAAAEPASRYQVCGSSSQCAASRVLPRAAIPAAHRQATSLTQPVRHAQSGRRQLLTDQRPGSRLPAIRFAGHLRSVLHRVSFREPQFLRLIVRPRHLHSR